MKKIDWVRCPKCGHKLFKVYQDDEMRVHLEIKCHSCKNVIDINTSLDDGE